MSAIAVSMPLAEAVAQQNELVRQGEFNSKTGLGGFRVLGRLIEIRHERPTGGNTPARAITDTVGLSLDWKHFHNGPPIGLDRSRTQLLFLDRVPPLPEMIDPNWMPSQFVEVGGNRVPLGSVPKDMYKTLGITAELEAPPRVKQNFVSHGCGTWGDFLVIGPLTQALYKIDGIVGMNLIDFASSTYAGDSPMLLINPATGEGHFLGGRFLLR
ncbi:MAG TPA: hypothetical protein VG345_16640 [Bryobacteraceae bacterium]|jgi:hypothetical protein|nr:hypothetical protein [Bryobacteraceae bacterium]